MPKFYPVKLSNTTDKSGFSFHCQGCGSAHYIQTNRDFTPCWDFNGDIENPTVNPSIKVESSRAGVPTICHSFIKDGKIQYLNDCTHHLAGKTVELPEF